jgi:formylglycine-generating enzyme required for sulfatase activity
MGSTDGDPAEAPVHEVHISAFLIDRAEVTNAEFAAFVASTGHVTDAERSGRGWHWETRWREVASADWRHPHGPHSSLDGLARHPVVQVSWHDARAYCEWAGARLPTEAEWERAARGAGDRSFAWGDSPPDAGGKFRASYGSNDCCAADDRDGYRYTAPAGSFAPGHSAEGAWDLTGNVWEWVADTFEADYYARSPRVDPRNDAAGVSKVIRGGGWGNNPWGLRATLRHDNPPGIGLSMVGFRCAREAG